jgi:hypothetical protein
MTAQRDLQDPQTTNDYWEHYIRVAQRTERATASATA